MPLTCSKLVKYLVEVDRLIGLSVLVELGSNKWSMAAQTPPVNFPTGIADFKGK